MRKPKRIVVLLHPDDAFQRRVRRAAEGHFELRRVSSWEEAAEQLRGLGGRGLLLADACLGAALPGPSPELRRLMASLPSATVVAVLAGGREATASAHTLGLWGVCQVLDSEVERTPEQLRDRLRRARGRTLRGLLERGVHVHTTPRGRAILDAAVDVAAAGGRPHELAHQFSVSAPTLLRWCHSASLPPPRRLLLWLRLLTAAEMLDDPGQRVMDVAFACGYSTDVALWCRLRRSVGAPPRILRRRGAFEIVARAFLQDLSDPAAPSPAAEGSH
jgi:AraC-like DNA-binding protein